MFSDSIYQSFTIENQISIVEGKGGFPNIRIDNQHASAVISIYGAQVLSYQPKDLSKELLYVSEKAYFESGKAIKGGIPICWPWFGRDQEKVGTQMHGFVRNMLWELKETAISENGETSVILNLSETKETQKLWPHKFNLTFKIQIGETLKLSLQTNNTGSSSFVITQAMHAYFAIDNIDKTKVLGLDNISFLDKVGGKTESILQNNDLLIDQEIDRIYTNVPSELVLVDNSSNREVTIRSKGSQTAIVWNPWINISKSSGDLTDDAYRQFVCIETANAVEDKVTIEANASYSLEAEYAITVA